MLIGKLVPEDPMRGWVGRTASWKLTNLLGGSPLVRKKKRLSSFSGTGKERYGFLYNYARTK